MKRVVVWTVMLTLLICLASPVFAAEFVPSITDKGSPDVIPEGGNVGQIIDPEGNIVDHIPEGGLIITPVSKADDADIPEDVKDLLKDLYEDLVNGDSKLPYPSGINSADMVIRDLFDVSVKGDYDLNGSELKLIFDVGVNGKTEIFGFIFMDGQWIALQNLVNNGDGTVTVVLPGEGQVAFAVAADATTTPDPTGDPANITLWIVLMAVSAVALIAVVFSRRKIAG